MFNNNKKKIQILQDELYITRLENASLRSRLAKVTTREVIIKTTKPKKATVAKKTTTKKAAK
jgi:regulator of replication initiation timing